MRGASIIVLAMSGAAAGAASGTSSGLEVDTIAEVDFASVSGTQVGAVSVGKSTDGKVWCNLLKDVDKCDRLNCDRFKCDRLLDLPCLLVFCFSMVNFRQMQSCWVNLSAFVRGC